MSISVAQWIFFLSRCASRITSFLLLTFFLLPRRNCIELLPFLVHCSFCIRNLHCLSNRHKFVNQIVMAHRSETFARNVLFMFCRYRCFHSLSCGFMRFHKTTISRIWNLLRCNFLLCNHFRDASLSFPLAQHGGCHGSFPFSPSMFESFFVILVIKINEVNSCQSLSIVEFWLLVFLLVSPDSERLLPIWSPYFWRYMISSGSRLNFCRSLTRPHTSL